MLLITARIPIKMEVVVKGYDEGSLNVVTILHTDRPSPYMNYIHLT